jgi:hypothetical protein
VLMIRCTENARSKMCVRTMKLHNSRDERVTVSSFTNKWAGEKDYHAKRLFKFITRKYRYRKRKTLNRHQEKNMQIHICNSDCIFLIHFVLISTQTFLRNLLILLFSITFHNILKNHCQYTFAYNVIIRRGKM